MPISSNRIINHVSHEPIVPPTKHYRGKNLYGRDLSFKGEETQHSTHSLHPYLAAINPPLARELINAYVPAGEIVLDPFCGGGGVLIEAILSDRNALGFDVNPLAAMIARGKTNYLPEELISTTSQRILLRSQDISEIRNIDDIDEQLSFWFTKDSLQKLFILRNCVLAIDDPKLQPLFKTILSATTRDVMLTYRGEVRLRKLVGKDLERFNPDVFRAFADRAAIAVKRIPSLRKAALAHISVGDVRSAPYGDNSATAIICSPPYADDKNGVGYFQFSRNMLRLIGFSVEEIKEAKSHFLGSNRVNNSVVPPSTSLNLSLEHLKDKQTKHYEEAVRFYNDYYLAIGEMLRLVKQRVVIVIGNRVLSRTTFDNAHITLDLMKDYGVELEHYYTRTITKKRIPNLGTDGGGISTEHILVFHK
jgi:site-specific DNA-methyltransferase (cytosine-N4-specific)